MSNRPPTLMDQTVFLPERLMESCEDDAELAQDVIADFLASTPPTLVRLAAAIRVGDAALTRLEAHSLKGSSQTLGGERLAVVSLCLESDARSGNLTDAPILFGQIEGDFAELRLALEEFLHPVA